MDNLAPKISKPKKQTSDILTKFRLKAPSHLLPNITSVSHELSINPQTPYLNPFFRAKIQFQSEHQRIKKSALEKLRTSQVLPQTPEFRDKKTRLQLFNKKTGPDKNRLSSSFRFSYNDKSTSRNKVHLVNDVTTENIEHRVKKTRDVQDNFFGSFNFQKKQHKNLQDSMFKKTDTNWQNPRLQTELKFNPLQKKTAIGVYPSNIFKKPNSGLKKPIQAVFKKIDFSKKISNYPILPKKPINLKLLANYPKSARREMDTPHPIQELTDNSILQRFEKNNIYSSNLLNESFNSKIEADTQKDCFPAFGIGTPQNKIRNRLTANLHKEQSETFSARNFKVETHRNSDTSNGNLYSNSNNLQKMTRKSACKNIKPVCRPSIYNSETCSKPGKETIFARNEPKITTRNYSSGKLSQGQNRRGSVTQMNILIGKIPQKSNAKLNRKNRSTNDQLQIKSSVSVGVFTRASPTSRRDKSHSLIKRNSDIFLNKALKKIAWNGLQIRPHSIRPSQLPVSGIDLLSQTGPRLSRQEIIDRIHLQTKPSFETTLDFYRIVSLLGEGSYGKVYKGFSVLCEKPVAIKCFNKETLSDLESNERVFQEIEIMSSLNQDGIIQFYELFEDANHYFVVMEFAEKGDLLSHLKENKRFKEDEFLPFFRQILRSLSHMHRKKILHRDIKLDNILVNAKDRTKICDFGISTIVKHDEVLFEHIGTPAYLAPEIVIGDGYQGFQADVWSLGVTVFIALTGKGPFRGNEIEELQKNIVLDGFEYPDDLQLSSFMQQLIARMLDKNATQRITLEEIAGMLNIDLDDESEFNQKTLDNKKLDSLKAFGFDERQLISDLQKEIFNHGTALYKLI